MNGDRQRGITPERLGVSPGWSWRQNPRGWAPSLRLAPPPASLRVDIRKETPSGASTVDFMPLRAAQNQIKA